MAEGQPISDEERRSRPLAHLLLYGIKMMVRRDIGAKTKIENHAEVLGQEFVGKTAAQAGEIVADKLLQQKNGIKERQSRTVDEVTRRKELLDHALVESVRLDKLGKYQKATRCLQNAAREMVHGESQDSCSAAEQHVLT